MLKPSSKSGAYRLQMLLIFAVFVGFLGHAVGVFDLRVVFGGDLVVHPALTRELFGGSLAWHLQQPDFLVFAGVGAVLALGLPALSPIAASALTFACMLPPYYVAWTQPTTAPLVPLEYALLMILILFSVNVLASYFFETRRRQKIIAAFGQYVPPALVDEISRDPDAASMVGMAREMSVLFCDVKNFSTLAEQLEADELAHMLNHYLTAMTDVLHAHGATIDKYIGDAIMAFWGAPTRQHDHAARAVTASLAMQARMSTLRAECRARDWPALEIGIGIASGMMSVGNMGSRYRIAYTVIGDAVNLAARLEALTRLYGVDVLLGADTAVAVEGVCYREIDHVQVRGKGRANRIFEPLPSDTVDPARLAAEASALAAYYAGDWQAASASLVVLSAAGQVPRWYEVLLERMSRNDKPADWDGVVRFSSANAYAFSAPEADA